jgi:hypothetical protein
MPSDLQVILGTCAESDSQVCLREAAVQIFISSFPAGTYKLAFAFEQGCLMQTAGTRLPEKVIIA